jgi:hypothetical protein
MAIELWKEKVYPHLVSMDFAAKSTITPYIVVSLLQTSPNSEIFHEATLVGLLEAVLYNKEACESGADACLDLVDYLHRQIVKLVSRCPAGELFLTADPKATLHLPRRRPAPKRCLR